MPWEAALKKAKKQKKKKSAYNITLYIDYGYGVIDGQIDKQINNKVFIEIYN